MTVGDFLMAKAHLPAGTIDLGIGEPHLLREAVIKGFKLSSISFGDLPHILEYAPPNGYGPLVSMLESRYDARVVVTTGAKQGLLASFHALKALGKKSISFRKPYWSSIPHIASRIGLDSNPVVDHHYDGDSDSCLLVMPNNPDSDCMNYQVAKSFCDGLSDDGVGVIHDGAYYTHAYLPDDYELGPLGDMQVFSASKMYGLSGLRLGWVVCHNDAYYEHLARYVEATTSGVSTIGQVVLMNLMSKNNDPDITRQIESSTRAKLYDAKVTVASGLDPELFEIVSKPTDPGMFAWLRTKVGIDTMSVGVNTMPGEAFGEPGMIRLSLSVEPEKLQEAIRRLNLMKS